MIKSNHLIFEETVTKLLAMDQMTSRTTSLTIVLKIVMRITDKKPVGSVYAFLNEFNKSKKVYQKAESRTAIHQRPYKMPLAMKIAAERAASHPAPVQMGMTDDIHKVCYGF